MFNEIAWAGMILGSFIIIGSSVGYFFAVKNEDVELNSTCTIVWFAGWAIGIAGLIIKLMY